MSVNRLSILLGAEVVALGYQANRFINKHIEIKHSHFASDDKANENAHEDEAPAWAYAITKLNQLIHEFKLESKTKVNISLSSDWVRFLTLPPYSSYLNKLEKSAYALAAFKEIYGEIANQWQIKVQDSPPNQPMLCVAIDAALLQAVQQLTEQHHLSLVSVQPYVMDVFNQLHAQFAKANGFSVIIETNRLILITLTQGRSSNCRVFPLNQDWQTQLMHLIQRERMLNDNHNQEVFIYAPSHKTLSINPIEGCHVKRVGLGKKNININQDSVMLEAVI